MTAAHPIEAAQSATPAERRGAGRADEQLPMFTNCAPTASTLLSLSPIEANPTEIRRVTERMLNVLPASLRMRRRSALAGSLRISERRRFEDDVARQRTERHAASARSPTDRRPCRSQFGRASGLMFGCPFTADGTARRCCSASLEPVPIRRRQAPGLSTDNS